MTKPHRVQLSRARGRRKPPNTTSVARPTRWGNPFAVTEWGRDAAVMLYRHLLSEDWSPDWVANLDEGRADLVYRTMIQWRKKLGVRGESAADLARYELRGKNLACWCALDQACHADVLLEIANH